MNSGTSNLFYKGIPKQILNIWRCIRSQRKINYASEKSGQETKNSSSQRRRAKEEDSLKSTWNKMLKSFHSKEIDHWSKRNFNSFWKCAGIY